MLLIKYHVKFSDQKSVAFNELRYGLREFTISRVTKHRESGELVRQVAYRGEVCDVLPSHYSNAYLKAIDYFPEDQTFFSEWLFSTHKYFEPIYNKSTDHAPMIDLIRTYPLDWNRVWLNTFRTMSEDVMHVTEALVRILTGQLWDLSLFSTISLGLLFLASFIFTVVISIRVLMEVVSLLHFRKQVLKKLNQTETCEIVKHRRFFGRQYTLRVTQSVEKSTTRVDGKTHWHKVLVGRLQFIPDYGVRLATTFRRKSVPMSRRPRLRKK